MGEFDAAVIENLERHLSDEQTILEEYPVLVEFTLRRLRAFERRDLRELRKLRRRFRALHRDSLNRVLVRALLIDTHKHLLYLRALNRVTRRR